MKTKTRKCIVCGKEYEYCNRCKSYSALPAWMAIYHDENCKNIMSIATEYMAGNLTKAEAKSKLDGCDLTDKKSFKESVAKAVNEICATKKSAKVESVIIEEDIKEDIAEQPVESVEKD